MDVYEKLRKTVLSSLGVENRKLIDALTCLVEDPDSSFNQAYYPLAKP